MTENNTIEIRDIGPHTHLTIEVKPGVNVVKGTNEVGKSLAVRAVGALAGGDGKGLPVRDGQAAGIVSGFGTVLTVSSRVQSTGDLEGIEPLASRMNLAELVDPGLKDESAATRRRIKALLTLTGTTLTLDDFKEIVPAEVWAEVVNDDLKADDPIEMAGKVKRALEREAIRLGKTQKEHRAKARSLSDQAGPGGGDDLPTEEEALRELQTLSVAKQRLEERRQHALDEKLRHDGAHAQLDAMENLADEIAEARKANQSALAEQLQAEQDLKAAERALAEAQSSVVKRRAACERTSERADVTLSKVQELEAHETTLAALREVIESPLTAAPTVEERDEAERAVKEAVVLLETVRQSEKAGKLIEKANLELATATLLAKREKVYRDGARGTDRVLADAVDSRYFTIREGKLLAEDRQGRMRPYTIDGLSEGARFKIAIQAVAEACESEGDMTLITLDQRAWDGLSTGYRSLVAQTAEEHNVAIVTAEVTDSETLSVEHYEPSVTEGAA